jgi:type IV secretory pathway TrbL component
VYLGTVVVTGTVVVLLAVVLFAGFGVFVLRDQEIQNHNVTKDAIPNRKN